MPSPTSSFSNDMGKCFVQKILVDTIRMQLDTNQQTDSHPEDNTMSAVVAETVPHSLPLRCCHLEMLNSLSRTLPFNHVLLDPMPSTLVSRCEVLIPVISQK